MPPVTLPYQSAQLQTQYTQLLQLRRQTDPNGIVFAAGWLRLQHVVHTLPAQPSALHHNHLQAYLNRMERFLIGFDRYTKLVKPFFTTYPRSFTPISITDQLLYATIQNLARNLFARFKQGNGFYADIYTDIALLAANINRFTQLQNRQLANVIPAPATPLHLLPIFEPLRATAGTAAPSLEQYLQQSLPNPSSGGLFTRHRLSQIAQGFFKLKAEELEHLFRKKNYLFSPFLPNLKEALKQNNHPAISSLLTQMSRLIPTTGITHPPAGSTTQFKVITVQGVSITGSKVLLQINKEPPLSATTNEQGIFTFEKIELTEGLNSLSCFHPTYRFLYTSLPKHLVYYTQKLPYSGRIDPITQQPLDQQDINLIWRCAACKNYMLNYSVTENDGVCPILKCDSKYFYHKENKEFWMA
ncbi:MAG TPA: hypothetical protein PK239_14420 [Chitinophagales bacterium]|nr:hypothetical protein [Chitinophagales bacterium]HRK28467.1 hypothetical protein [Chitinophagales bacterium]